MGSAQDFYIDMCMDLLCLLIVFIGGGVLK